MRVSGVVANLPVDDIEAARGFYSEYLGLSEEAFNLGWVARRIGPYRHQSRAGPGMV